MIKQDLVIATYSNMDECHNDIEKQKKIIEEYIFV